MGNEFDNLVRALPGGKADESGPAEERAKRPRLMAVEAVARRRRQARAWVEALTIRETTGEERRSPSSHPAPGGLVSSTRYLLERADREAEGAEHPRTADE